MGKWLDQDVRSDVRRTLSWCRCTPKFHGTRRHRSVLCCSKDMLKEAPCMAVLFLALVGCAFGTTLTDPYVTLTTAVSGTAFTSLPITFAPQTPNQDHYFTNQTGTALSGLLVTATTPASNPYVYPALAYSCNPGVAIPFPGLARR